MIAGHCLMAVESGGLFARSIKRLACSCRIVLQVGDKTLDIKHVGQDGILRGGCLPPPKGRLRIGRKSAPKQTLNLPDLDQARSAQHTR
jgi:hypothetical protein